MYLDHLLEHELDIFVYDPSILPLWVTEIPIVSSQIREYYREVVLEKTNLTLDPSSLMTSISGSSSIIAS